MLRNRIYSGTHRNQQYTGTKGYGHRQSVLEGAAARAIEGLTLTEANYGAAGEIVQERFGRPQQIISAHMEE